MTTYTIKPECIDQLCIDPESAYHTYTLEEVIEDADNFEMNLADYITKFMDIDQDNPVDAEKLLEDYDIRTLADYMHDDIREFVHNELAPCTDLEFVTRYLELADICIN